MVYKLPSSSTPAGISNGPISTGGLFNGILILTTAFNGRRTGEGIGSPPSSAGGCSWGGTTNLTLGTNPSNFLIVKSWL